MGEDALKPGLALDIDETLCITGATWMAEAFELFGNPHNLTPSEGYHKFWYKKEEVCATASYQDIYEYFTPRVTCNNAMANLPIIENANHRVEQIDKMLPISCYLTARFESVREGTLELLEKHGFPKRPLIMRPDENEFPSGNHWKAAVMHQKHPTIRGIVDDNPGLISALEEYGEYEGTVFLYSHLNYDADTALNVIPCKDWDAVHLAIRRMANLFGL